MHVDRCEDCAALIGALGGFEAERRQVGRYRLERLLGLGGMGQVYLAWDRPAALKPVSTVTRGRSDAARKLATACPAAARRDAERLHTALLAAYPQVEQQFGIPAGDVAGAMALLVIGSWEVHHGREVEPEVSKRAIAQLPAGLASSAEFARAARREAYEQLAILGMQVVLTNHHLRQQPDAATADRLRAVTVTRAVRAQGPHAGGKFSPAVRMSDAAALHEVVGCGPRGADGSGDGPSAG